MYQVEEINGVKLVYYKTNGLTNIFGIMTMNGALREEESTQGISHFCEHMFYQGTKDRTSSDLSRDIELMGASQNAYTSNDEVFYHLTCPRKKSSL